METPSQTGTTRTLLDRSPNRGGSGYSARSSPEPTRTAAWHTRDVTVTAWRKSSFSSSYNGCVEVGSYRKSSYSSHNGQCVEAGHWRKSSACEGGACAEVSSCCCGIAVRDTTDREGPVLTFGAGTWSAFLGRVKGDAGVAH